MERIEFVRLAASRARLAFERISADSVCPHRCIRVGGGAGDGDGDGDGARAGDRLAVASTVLAHHACQPSALPIRTPEEDRVLGEEITRQQALIQTENPKAQASADLTLNLTKAQLLDWLAGHRLDGIDHHGDANVPTKLMSLLDHPDPTRVDSTGKIPAGKDDLCTILYVANGCDDRQFSLVVRIGGVPSDAPMPCQGDSSNIFGLILGPGPQW